MRIRLLAPVQNARGAFRPGQIVDWPEQDARPLIDIGAAEAAPAKKAPAKTGSQGET